MPKLFKSKQQLDDKHRAKFKDELKFFDKRASKKKKKKKEKKGNKIKITDVELWRRKPQQRTKFSSHGNLSWSRIIVYNPVANYGKTFEA